MIYHTCSFCHELVLMTQPYCPKCCHEAHVARLDCKCPQCTWAKRMVSQAKSEHSPLPISSVIDAFLTDLRNRIHCQTELAMTPALEGRSEMKPDATQATPQNLIVVSEKLATAIRVVDDGLVAEFGNDFAYVIRARGGLIAASNANDGFVPPTVASNPKD